MKKTLSDRVCTMQIEFFPSLVESYTDPLARLLSLTANFNLIDVGISPHQHIAPDRRSIDDFIVRVRALSTPVTDIFLVPKTLSDADTLVDRIISD